MPPPRWSGDINGNWETFKRQIPAGLNFCLTGQPYWTTDCGGFFHPTDQYTSADYNELLTRWFQWSTFCPILRIHGYQTETEMWKWLPAHAKDTCLPMTNSATGCCHTIIPSRGGNQ